MDVIGKSASAFPAVLAQEKCDTYLWINIMHYEVSCESLFSKHIKIKIL